MEFKNVLCPGCGSDNLESTALSEEIKCLNCGRLFKKESELKVFFSYGHDNHADFVRALADAVEKRSGYAIDVWIDHVKLREGLEWRSEIVKGIEKSNSVLAFLSKYSARERGVCLDELAIAISSKHGMIRSVLLEKLNRDGNFEPVEDNPIAPPAAATAYQWEDMSNYKEYVGTAGYEDYINEKADLIIKLLESDEIKEYNDDIAKIREKLAIPQSYCDWKFESMLSKEAYTGRNWLKDKIEKWRDDENGKKVLVLFGEPGSGKSMFAAHLQHYNSSVAAALACEYNSDRFSDTDKIVSWLAYKLAMRLPMFRKELLGRFDDAHFDFGSGEDRFRNLILGPLGNSINGNHQNMIIVIDAVDEVKTGELKDFVKKYAVMLPRWLKVFITSRSEPEIRQCFAEYASLDFKDEANKANNEADLREYFKTRLGSAIAGREGAEEFFGRLVEKSDGVFAYAEKVCDNIIDDLKKDPGTELGDYPLPNGLHALFKDTLDRKEFMHYDDDEDEKLGYDMFWRVPLGMVVASPDPLPVKTLKKLLGWDENEYKDFRAPLSTMLCEENECLVAFHRSFGEWLNTEGAGRYYSSRADGLKKLAKKCFKCYEKGVDRLDEFMLTHLTKLLREAELDEEYEQVRRDDDYFEKLFELNEEYCKESLFAEVAALNLEIIKATRGLDDEQGMKHTALAFDNIGEIRWKANDFSGAIEAAQKAVELYERLAQKCPDGLYGWGAAAEYFNTASIFKSTKNYYAAAEYCEKAMDTARNLADAEPQNAENLQRLRDVLLEGEGLLINIGKRDEAKVVQKEIVETCRLILDTDPLNNDYRVYLANALSKMAYEYEYSNPAVAFDFFNEAADIRREMLAANPGNVYYRKNLARTLRYAARELESLGYKAKADEYYSEANRLNDEPENVDASLIDDIFSGEYVPDDADDSAEYEKKLTAARQRVADHPQDPKYKLDLIRLLERVGLKVGEYRDSQGAFKMYDGDMELCLEALEIWRELVRDYPENPDYSNYLAELLEHTARAFGEIDMLEEAMNIRRQLVVIYPEAQEYKTALLSCIQEALDMMIEYREEFSDGAFDYYDEALDVLRQLVKEYPDDEDYKYELANWLEQIDCELSNMDVEELLDNYCFGYYLYEDEDGIDSIAWLKAFPDMFKEAAAECAKSGDINILSLKSAIIERLNEEELGIRRELFSLDKEAQNRKSEDAAELAKKLHLNNTKNTSGINAIPNQSDMWDHNPIRLADLLGNESKLRTDPDERIAMREEELDVRLRLLAADNGFVNQDFNKRLLDLFSDLIWAYDQQKNDTALALKLKETELDSVRRLNAAYPHNGGYIERLVDLLIDIALRRILENNDATGVEELCEEALGILHECKYKYPFVKKSVGHIADIYYRLGKFTGNKKYFERALETARIFPDEWSCRDVIKKLGSEQG